MFHPKFPSQEPYCCDAPLQGQWPTEEDLHHEVSIALATALSRGTSPEEVGQHFADLIEYAMNRRAAATVSDSLGIYEMLLKAPFYILERLHNTYLVDDEERLDHIVEPK